MVTTRQDMEIWQNKTQSEFWVQKENLAGRVDSVRVLPGGQIEISNFDRRRNQEQVVDKKFDLFSNGSLSRARNIEMFETAEDYEELAQNTNAMSEDELYGLFKLDATKLKKELAEITSPLVLQRLKDFLESEDSDKAENITVAKVKAVEARYEELNPKTTGKVFETYEEAIAKPRKLS